MTSYGCTPPLPGKPSHWSIAIANSASDWSSLEKKEKKKQRHQGKDTAAAASNGTFNIPRNTDIALETAPVELTDLVQLRYYTEYQWLLDFSLYSMLTYFLSELYIFLMPERSGTEANLSLVWVILVILFTYKLLLSLNGLYFEGA